MHSLQFRSHVIKTRKYFGLTIAQTAKRFNIGSASINRWIKEITPKKRNILPTKIDNDKLLEDVAKYPDAYQKERAERLGVSQTGIWHALKRNRISYKKKPKTSKSG